MRHLLFAALLAMPPSAALAGDDNAAIPEAASPEAANPEAELDMTLARLDTILRALDAEAQSDGRMWQITIEGVEVLIVTDAAADRMRAITPVRPVAGLSPDEMQRVLQANFDTALDARYAIANGLLWSAFIHPLGALQGIS